MGGTMDLTANNLKDWVPVRMYQNDKGFFVDWAFLDKDRFIQPFFDDTIELRFRRPFSLLFRHQTPIEFLGELYGSSKGIVPSGIIFHVSRCGSTLITQMLAALAKNIVISEASVFDKIVRAIAPDETKIMWLRWMANALSQKRFSDEENFFIKFDSWGVLDLRLIERAFPDVPWIFVYRDPVEVIASNMNQPGAQMIPGAIAKIFPGLGLLEILQFSTEERFARTIAAFCGAAIENADSPLAKFINYTQLPEAVGSEICEHFGVTFNDEEKMAMRASSRFNAKIPTQEFSPDSERKRKEANAEVVRLAEKHVLPLYRELERLRNEKDK